jgi:trimeric autotransporter adhesin
VVVSVPLHYDNFSRLMTHNSSNNTHAIYCCILHVTLQTAKRALATVDALPAAAQAHAPGLFWTAFRLQLRLPIAASAASATATAASAAGVTGTERDAALHMLACMAEGVFKKPPASSSSKGKSSSSGSSSGAVAVLATPARLMRARHLFATHLAREAAALHSASDSSEQQQQQQHGLDSTPAFFYYAAAYAWLQLLSDGTTAAVRAMEEALALLSTSTTASTAASDATAAADVSGPRTLPSLPHYSWAVGADTGAVTAAAERCHTALCELLHCACTASSAAAGAPRALRAAVLRGLQSYPCSPALLCLLALGEQHSVCAQRMQHHLAQAQRARRRSDWQRGATALEWLAWLSYELRRCSAPPAPPTSIADLETATISKVTVSSVTRLSPGEWTPAVRSRMRRCFERAVSSDKTAAGSSSSSSPLVWRLFTAFELAAGCSARAKRLHIRAVHACPGCRALWVDAAAAGVTSTAGTGSGSTSGGTSGLIGAFSAAELDDAIEVMSEKELRLRSRPDDAH